MLKARVPYVHYNGHLVIFYKRCNIWIKYYKSHPFLKPYIILYPKTITQTVKGLENHE